jgi:hypothetical protein
LTPIQNDSAAFVVAVEGLAVVIAVKEIFGADIVSPPPAFTPFVTANELIRLFFLAQSNAASALARKKKTGKKSPPLLNA